MVGLKESRLAARNIGRTFGEIDALDGVTVDFKRETIHGLLGENGAGKSTLINALSGLDNPDRGSVLVDGEPISLGGPKAAFAKGIAVVQQELALCPDLTLLENLVLGGEPMFRGRINWDLAQRRASRIAQSIGVDVPWSRKASDVVVGTQQQVEIIRCLFRGADTLLLDEPSAALAPPEIEGLLALLRSLRADGKTIVLITHKLDEVLAVCDEVTVLRGGSVVHSGEIENMSRGELAHHVVGDEVSVTRDSVSKGRGDVALHLGELTVSRLHDEIGPVDLTVHQGEVVGIAGVAGNGQDELLESIVGLRPISSGTLTMAGADLTRRSVGFRRNAGLGYISSDRRHEGLSVTEPLIDNVSLGQHKNRPITSRGWLSRAELRRLAERVLEAFNVRFASAKQPASSLSGGNQQKIVFGRELSAQPKVLVAAQPTRGVDIKGISELHGHLINQRDQGGAIILMSQEIDELLTLSDRILVMFRGQVSAVIDPRESGARDQIGMALLGHTDVTASGYEREG